MIRLSSGFNRTSRITKVRTLLLNGRCSVERLSERRTLSSYLQEYPLRRALNYAAHVMRLSATFI